MITVTAKIFLITMYIFTILIKFRRLTPRIINFWYNSYNLGSFLGGNRFLVKLLYLKESEAFNFHLS